MGTRVPPLPRQQIDAPSRPAAYSEQLDRLPALGWRASEMAVVIVSVLFALSGTLMVLLSRTHRQAGAADRVAEGSEPAPRLVLRGLHSSETAPSPQPCPVRSAPPDGPAAQATSARPADHAARAERPRQQIPTRVAGPPAEDSYGDTEQRAADGQPSFGMFPQTCLLADGSRFDCHSLMARHEARLSDTRPLSDRIAPGTYRTRPVPDDPGAQTEASLSIIKAGYTGSLTLSHGVPTTLHYKLRISPSDNGVLFDVAGAFERDSDGALQRTGVWLAWNRDAGLLLIARYTKGHLCECHLHENGIRTRTMGLDDDLARDRGPPQHLNAIAALDTAGTLAIETASASGQADRFAREAEKLHEQRLTSDRHRQAAGARLTEHELDMIAWQEASRATATLASTRRDTCSPSRHAVILRPARLHVEGQYGGL